MDALLWVICLILGVPSALLILANWGTFIGGWVEAARRGKNRNFSFCPPFFSGMAGALACLACPLSGVRLWAWAPLLLDPSITLLVAALLLHPVARLCRLRSPFDAEPTLNSDSQSHADPPVNGA